MSAALAASGMAVTTLAIAAGEATQWPSVGGPSGGGRFTPLSDIQRSNLDQLKPVWEYRNGDFSKGNDQHGATAFQVTPLMIDSTLYLCTPYNRVIALDAETGQPRWTFDPKVQLDQVYTPACRGVAYWPSPDGGARIFMNTLDARLIALDAKTGKPATDFGHNGEVSLLHGLGEVRPAEYYSTSPPLVVGDRVLTGAFVRDGQRLLAPSGAVRAFDVRSGELSWVFDPVPADKQAVTAEAVKQGATLTRGTPNVWGVMSADAERGIVYVPMGNASPDHYGGRERASMDHFSSSVVALDAATGAVRWRFQTVHHDVWDYDVGAQPVLYDHPSADGPIPAVAIGTKLGFIFLLNRLTGEPLFPIEERPVPQSTVPGEVTSKTQPFPTLPRPLHDLKLERDELWGLTFWDKGRCEQAYDELDYEGAFTPPSLRGALEYPGLGGGINWGGMSIDPVRQRLVVQLQTMPFVIKLVPRKDYVPATGDDAKNELVALNPQEDTPYVAVRKPFLSPLMLPCTKPPWGRIAAIDLKSGEVIWDHELGNLHNLAPLIGDRLKYGTPNSGGSLQTGSGLVFIAATMDKYFRAFDAATGDELWRYELPYAGNATPMSYRSKKDGRQYIVIAAGGHGPLGTEPGDVLMAFALQPGAAK
jgi:quinoprotein glucose dehydrogenase